MRCPKRCVVFKYTVCCFLPREAGASRSICHYSGEDHGRALSTNFPGKIWRENSNELNCENSNELKFIVPGTPVTGDPSPRDPSSHCSHQSRQSIQEDDLDLESFGKKKKKKKRAGEGMAIEDAADDDKENGRTHNIAAELLTIVGQPGRLIDSKIMVELNILVVILCHDHAVLVN